MAKSLLEVAGIDISVFNAHLVQGAASTAAANMGVTTNEILKAADWSCESDYSVNVMKQDERCTNPKAEVAGRKLIFIVIRNETTPRMWSLPLRISH